ncbi:condensation domain-containing protein [Actinomadura rubrisoli]|uniref:Condensation domain-containing protein n=1 Tax=Actinomadura rubrisoli TaxID=2530368 RepID=A0A4R5C995_9ACTN|nr:condensation domain-containing protein [Actinomadura rubrisoli]TDD95359.1 hypothetical protein E1298_05140 [Actinomadura rubrisoli]
MTEWARALAALSPRQRARFDHLVRKNGDPTDISPISSAQKRIWLVERFGTAGITFHATVPLSIKGSLDHEILERSVGTVVSRHEALRTTFPVIGDTPMQVVWPPPPTGRIDIPITDRATADGERPSEAAVQALLAEELHRPLDLAGGPLFRARLFRLAPDASILMFSVHHIVFDEPSSLILLDELTALYTAFADGGEDPLPPLRWQYADFARWQNGERFERELAYWRRRLGDPPPALDLPTDHPRPKLPSYEAGQIEVVLPAAVRDRLLHLARAEKSTMFMTLLAVFGCLLCRYSGRPEVLIGTPMAARERAETRRLIGAFINILALRVDTAEDPTFRELLARVRETSLGAYSHQGLPFERVVEMVNPRRENSRGPLVQAALVLWNGRPRHLKVPGAVLEPMRLGTGTVQQYDVALLLDSEPSALRGELRYSRALFEPDTARGMVADFQTILHGAIDDADRPISLLPAPAFQHRHRQRTATGEGAPHEKRSDRRPA